MNLLCKSVEAKQVKHFQLHEFVIIGFSCQLSVQMRWASCSCQLEKDCMELCNYVLCLRTWSTASRSIPKLILHAPPFISTNQLHWSTLTWFNQWYQKAPSPYCTTLGKTRNIIRNLGWKGADCGHAMLMTLSSSAHMAHHSCKGSMST